VRTTATATRCQDCRELVIAAISTDALETRCDVIPLTRAGELAANLAGRRTMRLDTDRRLWTTGAYRIRTEPMPGDRILAEHRCGQPVPAAWTQPLPEPSDSPDMEVPF
jgi:hypothetical protein